jgi:hypothetical protein
MYSAFRQHIHYSQHRNFNCPRDGCLSLGFLAIARDSGTDDGIAL